MVYKYYKNYQGFYILYLVDLFKKKKYFLCACYIQSAPQYWEYNS